MWSVLQEEESANETGCELYVNRVLITSHRLLILDQRVSPHTACARIVEIISGQSVKGTVEPAAALTERPPRRGSGRGGVARPIAPGAARRGSVQRRPLHWMIF